MQSTTKQTLRIFWQHSKKYKLYIAIIVFGSAVVMASESIQPFFYRALLNFVAAGDHGSLHKPLMQVLYIGISSLTFNLGWRFLMHANNRFQAKTKRDLYRSCYNYVLNHSSGFFSNNFVGGLVSKMGRYDRAFETIADEIIFGAGRAILYLVIIFIVLLVNIPVAGLVIGVWIVFHLTVSLYLNKFRFKYDLASSAQDTIVTGHLADTITNANTIKVFASEGKEKHGFSLLTQEQFVRRLKSWDISNYIDIFSGSSMIILEVALMYVAVKLWQVDKITVGDFVLLQAYMLTVIHNIWGIGRNMRQLYQSMADANEMTEMLMTPHEVQDWAASQILQVKAGAIAFKDATFSYKEQTTIFEKFNLAIAGGERVALVGPSGGGKSTIVKLLFRFYDLNSGSIEIDGQDISKVTQVSLREQVSLVPQDPILFHRSILENIRYAKPEATQSEVIAAAKAAHCHEFIEQLGQKYETLVGERGVKLSGGERQRVAIARAILKNAPILVLDEATSSLDSESESLIQDALKTLMHGKTTIVIAHRLSTIMAMDRIVVIEDGKITEQGKHEELLKAQEGKYQKLWHIQSGSYQNE
ncbi:MAG TPA: ABC transporter ATP-binding protein [Patescibacteria group bacterium]|jgi:ATP-binding cassette subfamily B protein|nr:ABC transporter ATP-binding protein [Patescibacteria group bacterium]